MPCPDWSMPMIHRLGEAVVRRGGMVGLVRVRRVIDEEGRKLQNLPARGRAGRGCRWCAAGAPEPCRRVHRWIMNPGLSGERSERGRSFTNEIP